MAADSLSAASRTGGAFGQWGGRYVPETLMAPLQALEKAWQQLAGDKEFWQSHAEVLGSYVGRPTPLYPALRMRRAGGPLLLLKREDLCHTGAHKINNTLGQALLAQRLGKTCLLAETGAGQHGVATATAAVRLGMKCRVYMGARDMQRQQINVSRMRLLGAEVVPVENGSATLKDAMSEAMRDWASSFEDSHYVIGSAAGPIPYPDMVARFQSIIGQETRAECLKTYGRLPGALVACVGGGSNAIGLFRPFLADTEVRMYGVEAAGRGLDAVAGHAATVARGRPGVLHGFYSFLLQDADGQVLPTHSVSAGLDYPGIGPEHARLHETGRVGYVSATDREAVDAALLLNRQEGILPALESAHAVAWALKLAEKLDREDLIVVNLSGRGDKDLSVLMDAATDSPASL